MAGHEAPGIIAEVGAGVINVQPGDRVVVSLLHSSGHCFIYSRGRPYELAGIDLGPDDWLTVLGFPPD